MNLTIALNNSSSLAEVYNFVHGARSDISFWGIRYVYLNDSDGIPLDSIPLRVMGLIKNNCDFDEKEREFGKKIVSKIKEFYTDNAKLVRNKNLLTRLFFIISEFWIKYVQIYGTRFFWEREREIFDYYTEIQYEKAFGCKPQGKAEWLRSKSPDLWLSSHFRRAIL